MNQTRGTPEPVGGHVFLSYSHEDSRPYVETLITHLARAGVPVWSDHAIMIGEKWKEIIEARIDACVAVIVVMTPKAATSQGVTFEINRAISKQKCILPLLLDGEPLYELVDFHHQPVTGGKMPPEDLVSRLVVMSALGSDPSPAGKRQEIARRLDRVPAMRDEAQRATLAMRLRERFGEIIVENPSVSRIAFTFSQRPNGWLELQTIVHEQSEIFLPGDAAVVMLTRFLRALCTLSDQGVGD